MTAEKEFVYVAVKPGYGVKIGHSRNPSARLAALRNRHGDDVCLAHVFECDYCWRIERRSHSILKEHRLYGEWFSVDVDAAKFAISQAWVDFVLDDTPDIISKRSIKKRVDTGIGKHWAGIGTVKPPVVPVGTRPKRKLTAEDAAKGLRNSLKARSDRKAKWQASLSMSRVSRIK